MKTEENTPNAVEAASPEETNMPTETKTKKARKDKAAETAKTPREGSKLETVAKLLRRKNGCTAKDVMEACKWPAVSMPQQAKALGIKLRTEKQGRITRYWVA